MNKCDCGFITGHDIGIRECRPWCIGVSMAKRDALNKAVASILKTGIPIASASINKCDCVVHAVYGHKVDCASIANKAVFVPYAGIHVTNVNIQPKYKVGDVIAYQADYVSGYSYSMLYYIENIVNFGEYSLIPLCSNGDGITNHSTIFDKIVYIDNNSKIYLLGTIFETLRANLETANNNKHLCKCPIFEVVHFGCKCGGA